MSRSTGPLVKVNTTEDIQERIRAVAYFPIEICPTNITVAVYEARERYFKKCNFIEIIS